MRATLYSKRPYTGEATVQCTLEEGNTTQYTGSNPIQYTGVNLHSTLRGGGNPKQYTGEGQPYTGGTLHCEMGGKATLHAGATLH